MTKPRPFLNSRIWIAFGLMSILFSLISLPVLGLIAYNWFDEDLLPQTQDALKWKAPDDAFIENGYFILWGWDAPDGIDAYEHGKNIVLEHIYLHAQKSPKKNWEAIKSKQEFSNDKKDTDWRCDYKKADCVAQYLSDRSLRQLSIDKRANSIARYGLLKNLSKFEEIIPPSPHVPFPNWINIQTAMEAERIKAVYAINDGQTEFGLALLRSNSQLSRRMMTGSSSLIARKIALQAIHRDARIVSELIRSYPKIAIEQADTLAPILNSISSKSFSLEKAFAFEGAMAINLLESDVLLADPSKLPVLARLKESLSLIFLSLQRNASLNIIGLWPRLVGKAAESPANELDAITSKIKQEYQDALGWNIAGLFYPKNPIGKILANTAKGDGWLRFIERQHDVEGYLRLVSLQLLIAKNKVSEVAVPPFLASAPQTLRNPYSLNPMIWDSKSKRIIFEARQESRSNPELDRNFSVPVGL